MVKGEEKAVFQRRMTEALRKVADTKGRNGAARVLFEEMEDWANGVEQSLIPADAEEPVYNTLRKWLPEGGHIMKYECALFVEVFLKSRYRHALLLPVTERTLQRAIRGFFGQKKTVFDRDKSALRGSWVMYRRYRQSEDQFIASHLTIEVGSEDVLIAYDDVRIDQEVDPKAWIQQRWEGFCIPSGQFYYMMLRTPDSKNEGASNAKLILIDDVTHQATTSLTNTPRLYRMYGQSLIGVSQVKKSDMFETVIQRTEDYSKEPYGVIPLSQIPSDLRKHLTK